jgi:hypothetical protein
MDSQDDFDFTVDFTFIDTEHELWALGEMLPALEHQMPLLAAHQSETTFEELRRQGFDGDEAEISMAYSMTYHFAEYVLPRLLRGPFLISLWSVAELAMADAAKRLKEKTGKVLSLKDIRGKSDFDQAKKYFEFVLEFPLCNDSATFNALDRLRILRNAFAHANGQFSLVKPEDQKALKDWASSDENITIVNEYVIPSAQYVRDTFTLVDIWIRDLLQRTRNILNS